MGDVHEGTQGVDHDVVIAGGGPTGLVLAAELHLAGVDVLIVEPRATQELDGSRAGGLHARTLEVFDLRGVAHRFVAEGQMHPAVGFAMVPLSMADQPTRHPGVLALWQRDIERILAAWVIEELGVAIRRPCAVVGLSQDDDGVDVELADGSQLRTRFLVGCDGGRSTVRRAAHIDFPGLDATTSWMIAEVEADEEPEAGLTRDELGTHAIGRREPSDPIRVVLTEAEVPEVGEPTEADLRSAMVRVWGTDFGVRDIRYLSRFSDAVRQAAAYRAGRVLVAGDAAHVHPPQGGQGLNVGVQDAVNLGWKLAQVVRGTSSVELLDTYHAERHPVGERVLRSTMAQVAAGTADDRHEALRATLEDLLALDEPRRRLAAQMSGLDVAYDLGGSHPLVGRRMPDLDLHGVAGADRVSCLLHQARPVLLVTTGPTETDLGLQGWTDRVDLVACEVAGRWELPVVGEVPAPAAVLIRPDGHVAWAGDLDDPALPAALGRWFGPPLPA